MCCWSLPQWKVKCRKLLQGKRYWLPNRKKRKCLKIPFLSHFSFSLVCFVNVLRAGESLNLMLINNYHSQNGTFIVVRLLPFTFSHSVWLLGQPLKHNAIIIFYFLDQCVSSQMGWSAGVEPSLRLVFLRVGAVALHLRLVVAAAGGTARPQRAICCSACFVSPFPWEFMSCVSAFAWPRCQHVLAPPSSVLYH